MITRIEIDGFKTLHDVAIDIAPFQAFTGACGAGLSNLFDAIAFLGSLAESDLRSAFGGGRGEPEEFFTLGADGAYGDRMRLAVEMLVSPRVEDRWGMRADVKYTRMRYEIEVERLADVHGPDRLSISREALLPIQRTGDAWARRHLARTRERWLPALRTGRTVPFISTDDAGRAGAVFLHQDGRGGDLAAPAHGGQRTVLGTIAGTEFPHAYAAREEMRSWRTIMLNPASIRGGGQPHAHTFIGLDGGNLTAALARMKGEDAAMLARLARDLGHVVPDVAEIELDERGGFYRQRVRVAMGNGMSLPLPLLSDSVLRLLVLAALKNDPDGGGVLALDEPENGHDAATLRRLAPFLLGMGTCLADPDATSALRQVIVATRSSGLVYELARILTERSDAPVHDLPELLYAWREEMPYEPNGAFVPVGGGTRFMPVRPSQQLALDLEEGSGREEMITLVEIEQALAQW
ncbi:MAG: AAA family ATPase [Bacteroidetes bacterium]|nr:AAA family ATPase [Bacteroidota bacterium]